MLRIRLFVLILLILEAITISNAYDEDLLEYVKVFEATNKNPEHSRRPEGKEKTAIVTKITEPQIFNILNLKLEKVLNQPHNDANNNNVNQSQMPEFRLDKKTVQISSELESKYKIYQELTKMLDDRQPSYFGSEKENDFPNEILFNALKTQLKTFCCNKHQTKTFEFKLTDEIEEVPPNAAPDVKDIDAIGKPALNLFIMFNEEIKGSEQKDGLVLVDPNSLSDKSTIFPLGSIPETMDKDDVKVLMQQILQELHKPRYMPLLSKLSAGKFDGPKADIFNYFNNLQTRRYIKPHRCNYQAPLSKVFGGTRFIICTGYLNINQPSIYD